MKPEHSDSIALSFIPEQWGEVQRFARFYKTTYSFDSQVGKRVTGIAGNFEKATRLMNVIKELVPRIEEDEKILQEFSYSPAARSKELAAIIEAAFCSMYSTLDCFRWVFVEIYKSHRNVKDSTRKLFQSGHKGILDERIPEPIRNQILLTESWFNELRGYRDEMTHSDVGMCHREKDTGHLQYTHNQFVINEVETKLEKFRDLINLFLGCVFEQLNRTLKDVTTNQICGIFGGSVYERFVKPTEAVDFHSGTCKSHEWFTRDLDRVCPFANSCGAFRRALEINQQNQPE